MSAQSHRPSRTALSAIVAVLVTAALAVPADARPGPYFGVPGAPVNARGTDVAAPDQQVQRTVVNARGTDVAAPDQQSPISDRPGPVSPADGPDDSAPTLTLLALLGLALCLAGVGVASRAAVARRRSRATA